MPKCKKCGREIICGNTAKGECIAFDKNVSIYKYFDPAKPTLPPLCERVYDMYVRHAEVCKGVKITDTIQ